MCLFFWKESGYGLQEAENGAVLSAGCGRKQDEVKLF